MTIKDKVSESVSLTEENPTLKRIDKRLKEVEQRIFLLEGKMTNVLSIRKDIVEMKEMLFQKQSRNKSCEDLRYLG